MIYIFLDILLYSMIYREAGSIHPIYPAADAQYFGTKKGAEQAVCKDTKESKNNKKGS